MGLRVALTHCKNIVPPAAESDHMFVKAVR